MTGRMLGVLVVAAVATFGCEVESVAGKGAGGSGGSGGAGGTGGGDPVDRERAAWPIAAPVFQVDQNWVTDTVTGLGWERVGSDATMNYGAASARCEAIDGARVPTLVELQSLVDFAALGAPRTFTDRFPDARGTDYWTASPVGRNGRRLVDFSTGQAFSESVDDTAFVRCVRGGNGSVQGYEVDGDVVTDLATALVWQRAPSGPVESPDVAAHCGAQATGGFSDWRLPSARELHSLVITHEDAPQIDPEAFPGTDQEPYWTATEVAGTADERWIVDFSGEWSGAVYFSTVEGFFLDAPRVRCVR